MTAVKHCEMPFDAGLNVRNDDRLVFAANMIPTATKPRRLGLVCQPTNLTNTFTMAKLQSNTTLHYVSNQARLHVASPRVRSSSRTGSATSAAVPKPHRPVPSAKPARLGAPAQPAFDAAWDDSPPCRSSIVQVEESAPKLRAENPNGSVRRDGRVGATYENLVALVVFLEFHMPTFCSAKVRAVCPNVIL